MNIRGIRGATTVMENNADSIREGTRELLIGILEANPGLDKEEIGSVLFSLSEDLNAAFPAQTAREMGWSLVPMLCFSEIPVPGSLPKCIRVLVHWNTELGQADIHHVYLREARSLRPDLEERVS